MIGWSRERSAAIGGKWSGRLAAVRLWRGVWGGKPRSPPPVPSGGPVLPPPFNPIGLFQPSGVPQLIGGAEKPLSNSGADHLSAPQDGAEQPLGPRLAFRRSRRARARVRPTANQRAASMGRGERERAGRGETAESGAPIG